MGTALELRNVTHPAMIARVVSRSTIFTMTLVVLATIWGCTEECRLTEGLLEPYREALIYPERFDQWMSAHPGYFTAQRLACIDRLIREAADRAQRLYQHCDETFIEGSDFWNQCYDEVAEANTVAILTALGIAARGQLPFSQTVVGQQLIAAKAIDPVQYEMVLTDFFQQFQKPLEEALTCRECKDKFLGISL